MSSLKDSEEQTSPPATPGSRGVQVASSHFSKISANRGNNGCLKRKFKKINIREKNKNLHKIQKNIHNIHLKKYKKNYFRNSS